MKQRLLIIIVLLSTIVYGQQFAIEENNIITTFKEIPIKWKGELGFGKSGAENIYNKGFRYIIYPSLNEYQKLGSIYFDKKEDQFTYNIIDFSEKEINNYELKKLDNDDFSLKINERIKAGNLMKIRYYSYVSRNTTTKEQSANVREFFFDALLPLNDGDFELSVKRLELLSTKNKKLNNLLTKIKNQINNYLTNE